MSQQRSVLWTRFIRFIAGPVYRHHYPLPNTTEEVSGPSAKEQALEEALRQGELTCDQLVHFKRIPRRRMTVRG